LFNNEEGNKNAPVRPCTGAAQKWERTWKQKAYVV